jgi:hypothetical protein
MTVREPSSERQRAVREIGRYSGYGLTWALSVLLFLWIGYWLDGLGAFVGAAGGFLRLYRGLTATKSAENEEANG